MAVKDTQGTLISVAFDGLSAETVFITDMMLKFLKSEEQTVAMVDPNHVGKEIRSQLVLGGRFVTIGDSYFDVGLLQLSGISSDLYRVNDYTSDAIVLLTSVISLNSLLSRGSDNIHDRSSLMVTAVALLILRLFLIVSSSSSIASRQGIALLWVSLIFLYIN